MLHFNTHLHPDSDQWVTFIHGAGGSSAIWYRQVRDFKAHFNLLFIDLRGHGKSKTNVLKRLKRYSFESIGDEVMEVLDHLLIKKSHFIGISLGTIIIREIAERYSERVQTMVLGGAVMKLNLKGQLLMRFGVLFKSVIPYLLLYKLFAFIIMPRKTHKQSRLLFVNEARKLYQKEFKRWFALTAQINPLLSFFRMNDARIPILYVMGSEDHMFLPSITELAKRQSMALLHVIPDCGHVVNIDKHMEFNKRTLQFLKEEWNKIYTSSNS